VIGESAPSVNLTENGIGLNFYTHVED
jgi:hypothetical protein